MTDGGDASQAEAPRRRGSEPAGRGGCRSSGGEDGFAYAPHEVLTTGGEAALAIASAAVPRGVDRSPRS